MSHCPKCNAEVQVLLFMGVQPDGFVCEKCRTYFAPDGTALAKVI